jgi:hypothetical protein
MARRNDLTLLCPAETAISAAVEAVEKMAADERLTKAVVLLQEARDLVADVVDASAGAGQ